MISRCTLVNMKAITDSTINLKTAILVPLALVLTVLVAGSVYTFFDHEKEYNEKYVGATFLSVSRIFDSAVISDTATLSTTLKLITRDDAFRRGLIAHDRDSLLRRAGPIFKQLREQYGITHFYFTGADRVNLLRVHQPNRYGDKIERITMTKAEATGKPAAGLELGPLGTFTLRVVFPWYDGGRLIGYVELGEEIEHILQRIKHISGIDLYVDIDKQYLTQKDWMAGMRMLGRHADWDFLPKSVVTFQTIESMGAPIRDLLSSPSRHEQVLTEVSYIGRTFQTQAIALHDAGDRCNKENQF